MSFTEMTVSGIAMNSDLLYPLALLENKKEEKTFPIELKSLSDTVKPNSEIVHANILRKLMNEIDIEIENIKIMEERDGVLIATIIFSQNKNFFSIEVEPFEAAIFGLQFQKTIFLEDKLFKNSRYFKSTMTTEDFSKQFLESFFKKGDI